MIWPRNGYIFVFTNYLAIMQELLLAVVFVAVQSSNCVQLFETPWTAARQASLPLTIFWSLPKFMFIALVKYLFPAPII